MAYYRKNLMSSTKPEANNVSQWHLSRTEPWP